MDLYSLDVAWVDGLGEQKDLCVDARDEIIDQFGYPVAWPRGKLCAKNVFCIGNWQSFLEGRDIDPINPDSEGFDIQELYQRLDALYKTNFSPVRVLIKPIIKKQSMARVDYMYRGRSGISGV